MKTVHQVLHKVVLVLLADIGVKIVELLPFKISTVWHKTLAEKTLADLAADSQFTKVSLANLFLSP